MKWAAAPAYRCGFAPTPSQLSAVRQSSPQVQA